MRIVPALFVVAVLLLAGCAQKAPLQLVSCDGVDHPVRLYLGPGLSLQRELPASGSQVGNSFAGGFATNGLDEWLSGAMLEPLHLADKVRLTLWVEFKGTPAPIVDAGSGEGYQFFNQFGSDRTFQPGYATEYDVPIQARGTQTRYSEIIELPPGGFELEAGDRVRLLLTSLALDSETGSGHDILIGGPTASRLDFTARCADAMDWTVLDDRVHDIMIAGNQGLFTGGSEPDAFNSALVPLTLSPATGRLTIDLHQLSDSNPVKDDMDLEILDGSGKAIWSIGSPYSDEHGVLWSENLDYLRANNATAIRVNSYSGLFYQGQLTITQESGQVA